MRISFYVLVVLCFGCSSSKTQNSSKNEDVKLSELSIEQKAEQLKSIYQKLTSSHSTTYEKEYFEAFPESFESLNELYGNIGAKNDFIAAPLYDDSYQHVEAFFNLSTIDKTSYYNRIIDVCSEGEWDADAVNKFKHGTHKKVEGDIEVFCELLSKRKDQDIKSFWFFYFDGPVPKKEIPEELKRVEQIDKRIFTLMQQALKDVQDKWKGFGTNQY